MADDRVVMEKLAKDGLPDTFMGAAEEGKVGPKLKAIGVGVVTCEEDIGYDEISVGKEEGLKLRVPRVDGRPRVGEKLGGMAVDCFIVEVADKDLAGLQDHVFEGNGWVMVELGGVASVVNEGNKGVAMESKVGVVERVTASFDIRGKVLVINVRVHGETRGCVAFLLGCGKACKGCGSGRGWHGRQDNCGRVGHLKDEGLSVNFIQVGAMVQRGEKES